jgi:thiamine biosynthesis protein ThiI
MTTRQQETVLHGTQWDAVAVYFGEIAIKGGNRRHFTRKLRTNLKRALAQFDTVIEARHNRLLITAPPEQIPEIALRAGRVFGVTYTAPIKILPLEVEQAKAAAVELYGLMAGNETPDFAIRVRRSNKRFPMTSGELERELGGAVIERYQAPVRLKDPTVRIPFRIHEHEMYLEGPKFPGPGGLPMSVTGQVLTLFSGGIDSPPAAWLMMKRGCFCHYIHFHVFQDPEMLRDTKIVSLLTDMIEPYGMAARLHLVPYHPFEMALMEHPVPQDLELVIFRRFMARTACAVAEQEGYAALVTGDNLAQVASQTMENICAFDQVCDRPVFRPLLAYNKDDIISLAREINTYEPSILDYKDCCSLVANHPRTKPKLYDVLAAEADLPVDTITSEALEEMTTWVIRP